MNYLFFQSQMNNSKIHEKLNNNNLYLILLTLDKTSVSAKNTKDTRTITLDILIVVRFLQLLIVEWLLFTVKLAIFYMMQRALINVRLVTKKATWLLSLVQKVRSLEMCHIWCVSNLKSALDHATFRKSKTLESCIYSTAVSVVISRKVRRYRNFSWKSQLTQIHWSGTKRDFDL